MMEYSNIAGWTLLIIMVGVSCALATWIKHEGKRALTDLGSWAGWIIAAGFNFLGYMIGFKLAGLL